MTNAELKNALKALTGGNVKVRKASISHGNGIDIFLPRVVRLDSERLSAVKALVEGRTGRVDLLARGRFDINRHMPNYSIQPIFE